MKEIGQILKARREELGYSLPKMSERTKVSLAKLNAIEEGDLAYFKDELTYVKFYVRYYFNSLHLNYEDYKELLSAALDDYTQTSSLKKIEEIKESNARVKARVQNLSSPKTKTEQPKVKKKVKVDVGFVSMFVISVLIVLALVYVFLSSVLPMLSKTNDDNKVIVVPDPIVHEDDPVDPEDPVVPVLTLTSTGTINYEITGFTVDQDITFIILLPNSESWLSSKVDGVSTINPARGYYQRGDSYTKIVKATDGMVVELFIGYLASPKITVNGIDVHIDDSLVASKNKSSFYFTFKGTTP
jgi:transcriptional regulator with XRE-family HTH domain